MTAAEDLNAYKIRQVHADSDTFDDVTLIWLDAHVNESGDCSQVKDRLRLIVNVLKTFCDVETCITYIKSVDSDERLYVVVSGALNSAFIPAIADLSQIICIAVYCFNDSTYALDCHEHAKKSPKFVGAFMEFDPLLQAIRERAALLRSLIPTTSLFTNDDDGRPQKSIKDLSHENAHFIWFQLLVQTIFRLPRTSTARREMINECERQYKENPRQLDNIKGFQNNYKPNDAIPWYTRDSFVYRIINRALRTQNIHVILKFYPFIADLHDQLTALHEEFLDSGPASMLIAYRGQKIHIDELNRITHNVGRLVSMNSFFSTGADRELARCFAGDSTRVSGQLVSILYEVHVDTTVPAAPFGNVARYSQFPDEEEILFSIGAIFRIESVEEKTDGFGTFWLIRIRLVDERQEQELNDLFEHLKSKIGETSSLLVLAAFLFQMDDIAGAEQYYKLLRDELPEGHPDRPIVFNNLGKIAHKADRIQEALDFYDHALKIYVKDTMSRPDLMAITYGNIAMIHYSSGNYDKAKTEFIEVLKLQASCLDSNHELFITTRNNLGAILQEQGQLDEALEQYQTAQILCKHVFRTEYHPSCALTEGNLGSIYDALGRKREAIDCYERSLSINRRCLPSGHYSLVNSHANLGHMYIEIGDYEKALNHLENALVIEKQAGHGIHKNPVSLANIFEGFSLVYLRQNKLTQALGYCNQALKVLPKANPSRWHTYRQLGAIYRQLGIYQLAKRAYQEAIALKPNDELALAQNLHCIGLIQFDEQKHEEALVSYTRALEISKRLLPPMHTSIGQLFNAMGNTNLSIGRFENALEHFQKAMAIQDQSLPEIHLERARTLNNIGVTLFKLDRPEEATIFVDKAVAIAHNLLPDKDSLRIMFQTTAEIVHKRVDTGSSEGVTVSIE